MHFLATPSDKYFEATDALNQLERSWDTLDHPDRGYDLQGVCITFDACVNSGNREEVKDLIEHALLNIDPWARAKALATLADRGAKLQLKDIQGTLYHYFGKETFEEPFRAALAGLLKPVIEELANLQLSFRGFQRVQPDATGFAGGEHIKRVAAALREGVGVTLIDGRDDAINHEIKNLFRSGSHLLDAFEFGSRRHQLPLEGRYLSAAHSVSDLADVVVSRLSNEAGSHSAVELCRYHRGTLDPFVARFA